MGQVDAKVKALSRILKRSGRSVVAFSGGVDSTFLASEAQKALGNDAVAVTVVTPFFTAAERTAAVRMAKALGIRHQVRVLDLPAKVMQNEPGRCYDCKKVIFSWLLRYAKANGYSTVIEGSNTDDLKDHRPGKKALRELHIVSPLLEAGLTKQEIRLLSKQAGLATWDRPSGSCLATRVAFGDRITAAKLDVIEKAERYLAVLGLRNVRFRLHGDVGRIEVPAGQQAAVLREGVKIIRKLKSLGVTYVCVDLEGYRRGSMNKTHGKEKNT